MNNEAGLDWDTDLIKMGDSDTYIPSPTPPSNLIGIQHTYNPTRPIIFISFHMIQFTKTYNTFYLGAGIHRHVQYCVVCTRMVTDPSWAEAHLNDVRFNSNWVFFTNDDCLKVDIQFQKFLKIPKFGLTEGIIFNSENCKLSLMRKCCNWQISEMCGENSNKFFSIDFCDV